MAARKDNKANAASGARNWTKEPYRSQLLEAIRIHNGNLNRCPGLPYIPHQATLVSFLLGFIWWAAEPHQNPNRRL